MGYLKYFITVYLFTACLHLCWAQNDYNFSTFTPANWPVSTEISTLFQDSRNYLWIGHSSGVSRYDGTRFENFLFAANHQVGKVYTIAEDKKENVWIGTEQGLFLWKEEQLHFINTGQFTRPVYALHFDKDDGLWVGNSDGPFYIPVKDIDLTAITYSVDLLKFQLHAWKLQFPNLNEVKLISVANDNTVLFADGYMVYQYQQKEITPIWKSTGRLDQLNGIWARNKDTVYICSLSYGIQVVEHGLLRKGLRDSLYTRQMLVKEGHFFELTNKGIYHADPVTLHSRKILDLPDFANKWGTCLLKDKEQNFWIGSKGQLNYAAKSLFTNILLKNIEAPRDFYSIFQLPNRDIVFGANSGESYIKIGQENILSRWKKLFPHSAITGFHQNEDGGIWVSSSYEGLVLLKGGEIRRYAKKQGLRDNTNFFFLENNKKQLFTGGDAGVTQIIQQHNGAKLFKNFRYNTGSSDFLVFKSGIATRNGHLLFGSNHGLFELKDDSLKPIEIKGASHQNHNITGLELDAFENIWVSTLGDGILICKHSNGKLQLINKINIKEGLPTQIILQLLIDKDGKVWAIDYNSIFKIEKTSSGVYNVTQYEKNQPSFDLPYYNVKMFQSDDGKIWLASTSGILFFDPANTVSEFVPNIHLFRVTVFDNNSAIDTLSLQSGITLPGNADAIRFQYKSISFSNPQTVRYSYRLLGADSTWTVAGTSQTANFRNLTPGHYIFQVRASVASNQWSKLIQYEFFIESRFWQDLWIVVVLSLAVVALLLLLGVGWKKRIQKRADEKVIEQQAIADNLQYRLETEKIINYFAISISEKQSEDDLVWDVVKNCISHLGFEDCVIYLMDYDRNILVQKAAWGPKTDHKNIIINPIEIPLGIGIVGHVALNKKAETIKDVTLDTRYIIDDVQRYSEIAVPILNDGNLLGVIDSEHSQKDFYTQRHLQVLTIIASLCADKITIIKTIAEKRKAEIEGMKNKQKATEARLQSIRLQMNPHFLFNSLNSIQQMILTGDETVATRSLSKFSRLLRMVLIQSDKEKISLSKELEMLELYIELESQRFKESFEYSIYCDSSIDRDETQIPTLLIQPFVENAIWHGLMHKEGIRQLKIEIKEAGNLIVCVIEDNGIGRFASQHLKENSVVEDHHTGKAIGLTAERLKIFDEYSNRGGSLQIIDQKDEFGNASGTKVVIRFPA